METQAAINTMHLLIKDKKELGLIASNDNLFVTKRRNGSHHDCSVFVNMDENSIKAFKILFGGSLDDSKFKNDMTFVPLMEVMKNYTSYVDGEYVVKSLYRTLLQLTNATHPNTEFLVQDCGIDAKTLEDNIQPVLKYYLDNIAYPNNSK